MRRAGSCAGRGELGAVLLGLEAQLAARGVDVVAFFAAESHGHTSVAQHVGEAFLAVARGTFPREALNGVVGDEVYVRVEIDGEVIVENGRVLV